MATQEFYPIKGLQDGLDPDKENPLRKVPLRLEMDYWFLSPEEIHQNQRALFFPAFKKFMEDDPTKSTSFFQVAGIHGKPLVTWDEPSQDPLVKDEGYCTHDSILFVTWHRPYLLLFEQIISELMKAEIDTFEEEMRPSLREAAAAWRLPYWDWAAKKEVSGQPDLTYNIPAAFEREKVEIRRPKHILESEGPSFPNALYQFTMPNGWTMGNAENLGPLKITSDIYSENGVKYTYPYADCKGTSRWANANSEEWAKGTQGNDKIRAQLQPATLLIGTGTRQGRTGESLRDAFYRISQVKTFEEFATRRAQQPGSQTNPRRQWSSLEAIHDLMHGLTGGREETDSSNNVYLGHMSNVPVAAFDPIFWFHHCNVDRLAAIWQTLHDGENTWFDGSDPRDVDPGNFYIPPGHKDKPTDPLRPFRKDEDGNYWDSQDCREVTALGYSYPVLEKWRYTAPDGSYDREAHLKDVHRMLNEYNAASSAAVKADMTKQLSSSLMSISQLQANGAVLRDQSIDDYAVNVIYEKFALGGAPFTIYIFVGKVPDERPYTYGAAETSLIGEIYNFSTRSGAIGASDAGCGNCKKQEREKALSTGRVILTNALITRFKNAVEHHEDPEDGAASGDQYVPVLQGMDPTHVVPFLKGNLHWRVVSAAGELLSAEQISSLKVSLVVGKAEHFVDRSRPSIFHDYVPAYQVTEGRPNGAAPEDNLYDAGVQWTAPQE